MCSSEVYYPSQPPPIEIIILFGFHADGALMMAQRLQSRGGVDEFVDGVFDGVEFLTKCYQLKWKFSLRIKFRFADNICSTRLI
ncbi:MAG: hypothetical protein ACFE9D_10910 [Promethearchaeota archaeon]